MLITDYALIDEVFEPRRAELGSLYEGFRNHAYRILNFGRFLAPESPERDERIAIMAAFHDLPAALDGDLVYLERAGDLADSYLAGIGRAEWAPEIRLMIENHHKVTPYRGPHADLVEATRRSDWIDATYGGVRCGVPRSFVREVDSVFPLRPLLRPAVGLILRYAIRHPRCPLPMLRW